ncbi:MAG: hypothetical protein RL033_5308 [Pseudomonadota bacterium]|jgi:hypothetical protein
MTSRPQLTPGINSSTSVPRIGARLQWAGACRLLGGGALLAAAGILLFTTRRGRTLRTRWGSQAGALLGRQVGRVVGAYVGGHPIQAARLAQRLAR